MSESNDEKLSRVREMASGSDTWDLSRNDIAALKYVLGQLDALTARSSPPRSAPAAAWRREPPQHTDIIAHGSYWLHRLRERQLIVEVDDDGDVYRMSAEPCGNVRYMGGEWRPVCSSDSAPAAPGLVEAARNLLAEVAPAYRDPDSSTVPNDSIAALRAALGKDTP